MKKPFWTITLALGACAAVILSGCLKKSDPQPNNNAYLTVLQASPDAPSLNLFLNNENFFTSVIKYEQWASQRPLVGAQYEMSFRDAGSGDDLATLSDSLSVGWWYTLISYDSAASIKAMLFRNTVNTGATTAQALVRFLQLSPDVTDPVDIYIDTNRVFSNRTFADNRYEPELVEYQGITPGQYDITAIDAVSGDTLGAISGQDLTLMNTVFYTFYLRGLTSRTDSAKLELGYLPEGGF